MTPRVYVSSTYGDLIACREQVRLALQRLRVQDVAMEAYVAGDDRPVDQCLADVRSCDLYIGVFGWRYGHVPRGCDRSITELEYRAAGDAGKDRLIFLLDENAPWPPAQMEQGRGRTRLRQLRRELSELHTCSTFRSAEELGGLVATAVAAWLQGNRGTTAHVGVPLPDLDRYRQRLQQQYGRLDLEALTPPEREQYLQLRLQAVFVEQSVREEAPPMELPKALWRKLQERGEIAPGDVPEAISPAELARVRDAYRARPLRPALDVLADPAHRLLVFLGDPGAGKSTLARYVTLALASGDLPPALEPLRDHVPLLVELRGYARLRDRFDDFVSYLDHLARTDGLGLAASGLEPYLADDGRAVVVLDGLDELFDPQERETVARQIAGFAARYPKARVLVTSRVVGYSRATLSGARFAHYTLQDLDTEQVATFLGRWFDLALHDRPPEVADRRERVLRAIRESPSVGELAGNPLLLTILAIIGKHQELPRERWAVYDHAASVLVEHWDVNRHLRDVRVRFDFIGKEDKKELLRRVAYRMQSGVAGLAGNHLPRAELMVEFEAYLRERYQRDPATAKTIAAAMIDQFRERNFILVRYGAEVYGFVHRAFLEYFCADALVSKFQRTQELSIAELKSEVFGRHWQDESWREVLRLVTGMVAERFAGELVSYLVDEAPAQGSARPIVEAAQRVAAATQCLSEVANLAGIAPSAELTLSAVLRLLDDLPGGTDDELFNLVETDSMPAVATIGARWPGREKFWTWFATPRLSGGGGRVAALACGIAVSLFPEIDLARLRLLELAVAAPSWHARYGALRGLRRSGATETDVLRVFRRAAVEDPAPRVRELALPTLAETWRQDASTLPLLRERAVVDPDGSVRGAALQAAADGWPGDPAIRELLYERAIGDPTGAGRGGALSVIALRWRDRAETLPLLHERARADPDSWARGRALGLIAQGWRDHVDTLLLLRQCAHGDPDWAIRSSALHAIADGWREDPETLPLLRHAAVTDPDGLIRGDALEIMAEGFGHAETLAFLLSRAGAEPDLNGGYSVLRALGRGWPDNLRVRRLLRDRVVLASHWFGRAAAAQIVAARYAGERETLMMLADRARTDPDGRARGWILEAIARAWPAEWETPLLLHERAARDPRSVARSGALRAIAEGWHDDPRTLPLLMDRAAHDSGAVARTTALQALAEGWDGVREVRGLLLDRATADPDGAVRGNALRAIASWWHSAPDTLPLIRGRAVRDVSGRARSEALRALAAEWPDDATFALLRDRARADVDWSTRAAALRELAKGWHDRPETLALLRDRATNEPVGDAREATLKILAELWRDEHKLVEFLKDRLARDPDGRVRARAIGLIVQRRRDEPATLPMVRHHLSSGRDWRLRHGVMQALASAWHDHPDTLRLLRERVASDPDGAVRSAALWTIAQNQSWHDDPDTLPLVIGRALHDGHANTRSTALRELAAGWTNEPGTLRLLRERAVADPEGQTRGAALDTIALYWHDAPETSLLIRERATTDPDGAARGAALAALASGWHDDPDVRPLLADRIVQDADARARMAALQALAKGWLDEPETLTVARDRCVADSDAEVRASALELIAKRWSHDAGTLSLLRERALADPDSAARSAGLRSIARGWRHDASSLPLVRERATADPESAVRGAALSAIGECWHEEPDTLPFLRERSAADPAGEARGAALEAIAAGWRNRPDTLPLLRAGTANVDASVRGAALEAFAKGWPEDPDTMPLVVRAAAADQDARVRAQALRALVMRFHMEAETQTFLCERAILDPDAGPREAALDALVEGRQDDPETLLLLRRIAGDPNESLRARARDAIALLAPDPSGP